MKDLFISQWPTEPLLSSYFGLLQKLYDVMPQLEVLKCSICIEGAQMSFASTMMLSPGVKLLTMTTTPAPDGKEHRHPQLYFSAAIEGVRAIEISVPKM